MKMLYNSKMNVTQKKTQKKYTTRLQKVWYFLNNNTAIITAILYWHKHRYVYCWSRIEYPEIDPNIYKKMIFDKNAKAIQ